MEVIDNKYIADNEDIEQLIELSILAYMALDDFEGLSANELPKKAKRLDWYLANKVNDSLWHYLNLEVSKRLEEIENV